MIARYRQTLAEALRQGLRSRPDADTASTTLAALVITALTLAPINPAAALNQLDAAEHLATQPPA